PSAGEPGVKLPVKQMGDLKRLTLVKDMSGLDPADWATFVTVIPGATSHISRQGTVAEQVADLVRWAESTTGPGLAAIEDVFRNFRAARLRVRGQSRAGPQQHNRDILNPPTDPREPSWTLRRWVLIAATVLVVALGLTAYQYVPMKSGIAL